MRLAGKDDNNSVASTSGDNTPTAFNNINIITNNLYARVDLKMKKKPPTISSAEENKGNNIVKIGWGNRARVVFFTI